MTDYGLPWSFYKGKKVLVIGNTGFKGSWLCRWLLMLDATVIGFSLNILTDPANHKILSHENLYKNIYGDIRNLDKVVNLLNTEKPDIIFHLAAQAIVKTSLDDPIETFSVNAIGTATILEAIRLIKKDLICIIITSDKVYKNVEWNYGYREIDDIGGKDPYSASKSMAEIVINCYIQTFFSRDYSGVKIGVGRAGNVIGGGDWSEGRLIPDSMKSWGNKKRLTIRNPNSTRPWQHVLEPLGGYLYLAYKISINNDINYEAFNFGPPGDQDIKVVDLIKAFSKFWKNVNWNIDKKSDISLKEAKLLKLNCEKAYSLLNWKPILKLSEMVEMTSNWYKTYYEKDYKDLIQLTEKQIKDYMSLHKKRSI